MTTTAITTTASTACYLCGGEMATVTEKAEIAIGNRSTVVDVTRSHCQACNETFYTPEEMEAAQRAAAEKLRQEEDLLGSAEIRDIRARLGLTQVQLEKLLGVGPKTVVRWERGTVFQSHTADALLRLIRDVPSAFQYLIRKQGVAIPVCVQEQIPLKQRSKYVTAKSGNLNSQRNVIGIDEWNQRVQHKRMNLRQQEPEMPAIPIEALR